MNSRADSSSPV